MNEMMDSHELNALVAERVMDMIVKDGWIFLTLPVSCPDRLPGCAVMHYDRVPHRPEPYSTSMDAAWKVVTKLGSWRGSNFVLRRLNNGLWEAGWFERADDNRVVAIAETPAVAICLAALKAVGTASVVIRDER